MSKEERKSINVRIPITDISNYKDRIRDALEFEKGSATSNGIISDISDYVISQRPYMMCSAGEYITFVVTYNCLVKKFFPGDMITLTVDNIGPIITVQNQYFNGVLKRRTSGSILENGTLSAFVISDIVRESNKLSGVVTMYSPDPIVYRIELNGKRSDLFKKTFNRVKRKIEYLKTNEHFIEIMDHLFTNINGELLDENHNENVFYFHYNSILPIAFYRNVSVSHTLNNKYDTDSNHIIADLIENRMLCVEDILKNYDTYCIKMPALNDYYLSIKNSVATMN